MVSIRSDGGVALATEPKRTVAAPRGGGKEVLVGVLGVLGLYLIYCFFKRPIDRFLRRMGIKTRHGPRAHKTNYRRNYRRHGPGRA